MASQFVAPRNTCFAIISAIEDDFRTLIRSTFEATDKAEILPSDVREIALNRRAADTRARDFENIKSDVDLLNYIDFADIAKILDSRISIVLEGDRDWLRLTSQQILALAPTRNRVCHSRPLEADDLASCFEFARRLTSSSSPLVFSSVSNALKRLEKDPTYVLTLQIPQEAPANSRSIHHNLPLPEFDETGFLGRSNDRVQLGKLLHSHYPIVTIVGEGGLDKTALALRCLFDLIDEPKVPYDAVVWVTLKTSSLTQAGIREISGAISSTLGLLSEIAGTLGTPHATSLNQDELIQEIVNYLTQFRILIAIDNLETISTGPLRDLLAQIPATSKILITSRVGIGEFEARYALGAMDEKTSVALMRIYSRVLGISTIAHADESTLKGYCRKLFLNPLLIKWFVASVGRGADPSQLVNKKAEKFGEALDFCFANLFQRLGQGELTVISTLACARKGLSSAEIHFLNPGMSQIDAEGALSGLHNSSIVTRKKGDGDGLDYELSDSALAYLSKNSPPDKEAFLKVQGRLRELRRVLEISNVQRSRNKYEIFSVKSGNSQDHRIAAVYLRQALDALKINDFSKARAEVSEAIRLTPGYSDAWRISAIVEGIAGETYRAMENHEHAVSVDPNCALSQYTYAQFLIHQLEDPERGLEHIVQALRIDPDDATLLSIQAMALTRMGRYEESARIYDDLLSRVGPFPRRWRISTTDQAAECYRRWCELDRENRDVNGVKKHSRRAVEILRSAVLKDDFDKAFPKRLARVIDEALCIREVLQDVAYVEEIVVNAEGISNKMASFSIPIIQFSTHALQVLTATGAEAYKDRLLALDGESANRMAIAQGASNARPSDNRTTDDGEYKEAEVHNIPPGAVFGFLADRHDVRWFFHRNYLRDKNEWNAISRGKRVKFKVGTNEKGSCAVDITLID